MREKLDVFVSWKSKDGKPRIHHLSELGLSQEEETFFLEITSKAEQRIDSALAQAHLQSGPSSTLEEQPAPAAEQGTAPTPAAEKEEVFSLETLKTSIRNNFFMLINLPEGIFPKLLKARGRDAAELRKYMTAHGIELDAQKDVEFHMLQKMEAWGLAISFRDVAAEALEDFRTLTTWTPAIASSVEEGAQA